jgi:hypothetical protein
LEVIGFKEKEKKKERKKERKKTTTKKTDFLTFLCHNCVACVERGQQYQDQESLHGD